MPDPTPTRLLREIRIWLVVFIVLLVLSGLTAFPIQTEMKLVAPYFSVFPTALRLWMEKVAVGIDDTYSKYPFLAYGYDWLAFAHLVIAVAFIGPYRDPVRNIWVIEFGMIACAMVLPLAWIAGPIRGIPVFWRIIDSAFGVLGILPLWWVWRKIKQLGRQTEPT